MASSATSSGAVVPSKATAKDLRSTFHPSPCRTSVPEHKLRTSTTVHAKKKGFFDEMLDVMEGGPKLRKWYGQDSSVGAPGAERDDSDDTSKETTPVASRAEVMSAWDKQPRKATLVTDVDTMLGEAIVVQLIVAKQPVVAMGLSPVDAEKRFGPYVTAADAGDLGDEGEMGYLLRKGVRAVICVGEPGALPKAAAKDGKVKHVIVVGSSGKGNLLSAVLNPEDSKRKDPKREEAFVKAFQSEGCDVPLTLVRPGTVRPGLGGKAVAFSQNVSGNESAAQINLEDAAECVVRCLGAPPKSGVLRFDVVETNGERRSWKTLFGELV